MAFKRALVDTVSTALGVKCSIQDYRTASSGRRLMSDATSTYFVDVVSGLTPETCINKIESSVTEEEFVKNLRANSGLGVVKVVTLSSIDVSTTASPTLAPTILISANSNTSRAPKGLGKDYPHPVSHTDCYPCSDTDPDPHTHPHPFTYFTMNFTLTLSLILTDPSPSPLTHFFLLLFTFQMPIVD